MNGKRLDVRKAIQAPVTEADIDNIDVIKLKTFNNRNANNRHVRDSTTTTFASVSSNGAGEEGRNDGIKKSESIVYEKNFPFQQT